MSFSGCRPGSFNKSEAARALGLERTTFLDKLERHGLHTADLTEGTAA